MPEDAGVCRDWASAAGESRDRGESGERAGAGSGAMNPAAKSRLWMDHHPDAQACVSLHPQAWLVAEPGGAVVQRAVAAFPQAWRLRQRNGIRATVRCVSGRLQCSLRSSVPLDVHGPAIGAGDTLQSVAPSTAIWTSLDGRSIGVLAAFPLPSTALQAVPEATGSELVKWTSSLSDELGKWRR